MSDEQEQQPQPQPQPHPHHINGEKRRHHYTDYEEEQERPHCCKVFCREILPCQPWFLVEDPSTSRRLDVARTFGPWGILPILCKVLTCGYVVKTQIMSWLNSPDILFYYAYYTSWALAFSTVYSLLSFMNSICKLRQPECVVRGRARTTWIFFNLAVFAEALATIIFWSLVFDYGQDTFTYLDIATHGIVFLVLCIDGYLICRIPLRWAHIWISWTFLGLYFVWTILQFYLGIGNPNEQDDDDEINDDAIYASLSWREEDLDQTVTLSLIVLFGVTPILFAFLRGCSLWSGICCGRDRRRYVEEETGYLRWF